MTVSVLFAALILFGFSTYVGLIPIHRMILRREAQHELRLGSASYFRRTGGLVFVTLWVVFVIGLSTILGDWAATGNLDAALDRAGMRIGLLLQVTASFGGLR